MEPLGALLLVLTVGGFLVALDVQRKRNLEDARRRARAKSSTPVPRPPVPGNGTPAPGTGGGQGGPEPEPYPDDDREEIPGDRWQEICWWTMESKADAYLEIGTTYTTIWPLAWRGDEDHLVYMDPGELADVEVEAFLEDGEMFLDVTITPKSNGWGTLVATEGTPGVGAVSGETPWRSQCMKIEVV